MAYVHTTSYMHTVYSSAGNAWYATMIRQGFAHNSTGPHKMHIATCVHIIFVVGLGK